MEIKERRKRILMMINQNLILKASYSILKSNSFDNHDIVEKFN